MKITKDLRKYSAEQGIAEEEALNKGMGGMSKEFVASVSLFKLSPVSEVLVVDTGG